MHDPSPTGFATTPPIDPSLRMTPAAISPSYPQQQYCSQPSTYPSSALPGGNNFDFLDDISYPDASSGNAAPYGSGEWDLGFGAGGLSFAGNPGSAWDHGDGFDMFEGFFFGGNGGNGSGI